MADAFVSMFFLSFKPSHKRRLSRLESGGLDLFPRSGPSRVSGQGPKHLCTFNWLTTLSTQSVANDGSASRFEPRVDPVLGVVLISTVGSLNWCWLHDLLPGRHDDGLAFTPKRRTHGHPFLSFVRITLLWQVIFLCKYSMSKAKGRTLLELDRFHRIARYCMYVITYCCASCVRLTWIATMFQSWSSRATKRTTPGARPYGQ
jgi:hypothetical protein